jgi:AbrB family looped-hinge helix DNA binding protein
MKTTRYYRILDPRGRISIPKTFRVAFGLEAGDEFRVYYENDFIIIKKEKSPVPRLKYHQDEC